MSGNTLDIKEKWEMEMNVIIDDDSWEDGCERGHKITNSPSWKEFNWKIKMRYFRTPLIVSKYNGALTNLCWRDCKQIGDHTHIFGACPKLKSFWEGIRTEILAILNIDLPLDAQYYILGVIPEGAMDKTKGYLLHICSWLQER